MALAVWGCLGFPSGIFTSCSLYLCRGRVWRILIIFLLVPKRCLLFLHSSCAGTLLVLLPLLYLLAYGPDSQVGARVKKTRPFSVCVSSFAVLNFEFVYVVLGLGDML